MSSLFMAFIGCNKHHSSRFINQLIYIFFFIILNYTIVIIIFTLVSSYLEITAFWSLLSQLV